MDSYRSDLYSHIPSPPVSTHEIAGFKVRPGMFARAQLNFGTENHVVVPDVAIVKQPGSGERFVYVYNNGKVNYVRVELGQRLGDAYELLGGVADGTTVVVEAKAA